MNKYWQDCLMYIRNYNPTDGVCGVTLNFYVRKQELL